jgi:hypothetical protein
MDDLKAIAVYLLKLLTFGVSNAKRQYDLIIWLKGNRKNMER